MRLRYLGVGGLNDIAGIQLNRNRVPAVWFPAVRSGTGTDVFTERLIEGLAKLGIRTEATWLPLRAEYAPWTVSSPQPPSWATVAHVNTWLHPRFLPSVLPIVATLHHAVHHPDLLPYKGSLRSLYHRRWIRKIERNVMRRADVLVAVSEFAANTARRTLLDRPMHVIHNGVDTDRFHPAVQRVVHRPFRLLYIGKWAPLKGVDLLPSIMHELGAEFELRYTGAIAEASGRANLPSNMHDIGRLQTAAVVADAMRDSDALLFPSRSEGFGLVAVEAMACGMPVIATRGSSLVEVVEDGVTGILCRRDDVMAFAAAARRLAAEPALAAAMSGAARGAVEKCFSIDAMVDSYVALYAGLLGVGSTGSE